jgi:hypothetical protein
MFQFAPLLWGAGLGALGSLVMGKDPLKGALVGGATGGLLGSIPALGAGGVGASTGASVASAAPTAMGVQLAPAATIGLEAPISYSLAPEIATGAGVNLTQGASNLATINAPYAGFSGGITNELGANMAFNPVNGLGMPSSSSVLGKGSIDNLAQYSTGTGYDLMAKQPTMFDQISPYLNVKDVSGAAQIASQFQPEPLPTPQSGNVTRGQAPQGNDVMSLLKSIRQPERRRLTLL